MATIYIIEADYYDECGNYYSCAYDGTNQCGICATKEAALRMKKERFELINRWPKPRPNLHLKMSVKMLYSDEDGNFHHGGYLEP